MYMTPVRRVAGKVPGHYVNECCLAQKSKMKYKHEIVFEIQSFLFNEIQLYMPSANVGPFI